MITGFGPPPAFDPACQAYLDVAPPLPTFTPEVIAFARQAPSLSEEEMSAGGAFAITYATAPGRDGHPDVPLVVARPVHAGDTALPILYAIHGGGMILGHVNEGIGLGQAVLPEGVLAVVVSVDYRLAPENPHPAPVMDCVAGAVWCLEQAASLGADPGKVVLVGASAGGGLGAAAALYLRDHGLGRLLGQLLLFPMLDDRNNSLSTRQLAQVGIWRQDENALGWGALLGAAAGTDDVSCYAAPSRATDLSGLPPAYLDAGSNETFRDEILAYASGLWRDGGTAELHIWPGGFHGHSAFVPDSGLALTEWAARRNWLSRLLTT